MLSKLDNVVRIPSSGLAAAQGQDLSSWRTEARAVGPVFAAVVARADAPVFAVVVAKADFAAVVAEAEGPVIAAVVAKAAGPIIAAVVAKAAGPTLAAVVAKAAGPVFAAAVAEAQGPIFAAVVRKAEGPVLAVVVAKAEGPVFAAVVPLGPSGSQPKRLPDRQFLGRPPLSGGLPEESSLANAVPNALTQQPRATSPDRPSVPGLDCGRLIGRGSFARVYKGRWQGRRVAVKVLGNKDTGLNCQAMSECLMSQHVRHPNVVETYEVLEVQHSQPGVEPDSEAAVPAGQPPAASSPAASSPAEAGPHLQHMIRFFEDHGLASAETLGVVPVQEPLGASPFAAAAATPINLEAGGPVGSPGSKGCGDGQLRGILDDNGKFLASRAATVPLAPSPFEAAMMRALSGGGDCGGVPDAEAAAPIIPRSISAEPQALPARRASGSLPGTAAEALRNQMDGDAALTRQRGIDAPLSALPNELQPRPQQAQHPQSQSDKHKGTALVMEYADQGSLHSAISCGRLKGNLGALLLCARDIARGMSYLHSRGVMHADLTPGNVLLTSGPTSALDPRGFVCKIADFGLARMLPGESSHITLDMIGSLPYMAPEVLEINEMTKAGDVYSFAILLLELWSGVVAYPDENYFRVMYSVFCGSRPLVPADMPAALRTLMEDCWASKRQLRPTFEAVLTRLATLLDPLSGTDPLRSPLLTSELPARPDSCRAEMRSCPPIINRASRLERAPPLALGRFLRQQGIPPSIIAVPGIEGGGSFDLSWT